MNEQHRSLKALLIFIGSVTAPFCHAADKQLSDVLRELVPADAQPCQDNKSCSCVTFRTDAKLPMRFVRAQYCPGTDINSEVRFTSWNQNNAKVDEGVYLNKKMHGRWISWHPNGNKAAESYFENGNESGPFTTWHENGKVAVTGEHIHGEPHGLWIHHDKKGNVEKRIKWDHGKLISKEGSS